jgi:hypothetical protein
MRFDRFPSSAASGLEERVEIGQYKVENDPVPAPPNIDNVLLLLKRTPLTLNRFGGRMKSINPQHPHFRRPGSMAENERKSGIELVGDVPWCTNFCQFYQTKDDLTDILVPYF